MRSIPLAVAILATSVTSTFAVDYITFEGGDWHSPFTWDPSSTPLTGSTDSVSIGAGHTVIFTGAGGVGLPGSSDLGAANGQTISINGGVLSQSVNWWIRIGHQTDGTLNINDGRFHFSDVTAPSGGTAFQVGILGAHGFVNVGDGAGAPGSAVLNLRHTVNGSENGANVEMNLGASPGASGSGAIVIKSDGVLEGDVRTATANPIIRVGQQPTLDRSLSSIVVNGGLFNARGSVEIAAMPNSAEGGRTNGLIRLHNSGQMRQTAGEFTVGYNGDAVFAIEDNAVYTKANDPLGRLDIFLAREPSGVGTVTVGSGGKFIREAGGDTGDLRIGFNGTGVMTINDGGLVENNASNWDWVGEHGGSNGTLTINTGGAYRSTGGAYFNVGVNAGATGTVTVNGGTLEFTAGSLLRVGQNGTGTFRQISGTTEFEAFIMAENDGVATFDLQGGTIRSRSSFFMGGASTTSPGTGRATATQSGGTLEVSGPLVVGLATGHTATFTQTGGTITHLASDISIGESGFGTMTIEKNGTLNAFSGGSFFVGRNDGSNGELFVNGRVDSATFNPVRVGNGNSDGVDNTNGTGLLGGTGHIIAAGGVRIGTQGTLTGGTLTTVGTLGIEGPLSFSIDGTFFANFAAGNADRISLTGSADITGALLDGTWTPGGTVGPASRYWLLVNDGNDSIIGTFFNMILTGSAPLEFPNADGWVTINGQEFAVNYSADFATNTLTGGNDLLLRAVPEPSVAILLGSMLCLTFGRRRRNARQA